MNQLARLLQLSGYRQSLRHPDVVGILNPFAEQKYAPIRPGLAWAPALRSDRSWALRYLPADAPRLDEAESY